MQMFATMAVDIGGNYVILEQVELVYDARAPHPMLVVNEATADRLGLIKSRLNTYHESHADGTEE